VAAKTPPKPKAEPEAAPQEARATPPAPPPPPKVAASTENTLLIGAQPTVPAGSFDSRWSAIQ
jgi:hypothetical protein